MLLGLLTGVCFITGCAAIGTRVAFDDRYFSGVRGDYAEIFENDKVDEKVRVPRTIAALDMPFSFAVDIVLLPFDAINPAAAEAARDLPVDFGQSTNRSDIFTLKSHTKKDLALTITARDWDGNLKFIRTNTCLVVLPGNATRQISLLAGWVKQNNQVKIEIACPKYNTAGYYVDY
jgi:uncharacterized protein YceK